MNVVDSSPVPNYLEMLRLDGKVFIVFGAGQGIGRQAAHALAQAGASVVCVGRSPEPTERVANEVKGIALLGDATKRKDMERIFAETAARFGAVHGVVDILGMVCQKPLTEFTDEDWDWQFDIVMRHAFLAIQLGGEAIAKAGGGSITLVGSVSALNWLVNHTVYGAAKAGLNALVRNAAMELAPRGVRVNIVSPSVTATPRVQGYFNEGRGKSAVQYFPMGFLATPSDVAAPLLFMASEMARYITGANLVVDGGHNALESMPASLFYADKGAS